MHKSTVYWNICINGIKKNASVQGRVTALGVICPWVKPHLPIYLIHDIDSPNPRCYALGPLCDKILYYLPIL